jgi:hypothetical protein
VEATKALTAKANLATPMEAARAKATAQVLPSLARVARAREMPKGLTAKANPANLLTNLVTRPKDKTKAKVITNMAMVATNTTTAPNSARAAKTG